MNGSDSFSKEFAFVFEKNFQGRKVSGSSEKLGRSGKVTARRPVGVQFPKETSPSAKRVRLLYRKGTDSQIETAEVRNYRIFEQMAYALRMLHAFSKFPWEWHVHCETPDGYVRKTYFVLLSTTHPHPVTYFPEEQLTEQTFTEVPTQSFVTISYPILIFPPPMSSRSPGDGVQMPTFPSSMIFSHHLFDHHEITSPFVYVVEEASWLNIMAESPFRTAGFVCPAAKF